MKKNIVLGIIIGLVILSISGCSLMGTSITDRISYFVVELNLTRNNIIDHFHPDAANYNNLDANYFEKGFLFTAFGPHSVSGVSVNSSTATGTLSYNDGGVQTASIVFQMRDDGGLMGEDWKIYSFTVDGTPQF